MWDHLGDDLGHLGEGPVFGAPWAILGPPWVCLLVVLGTSCGHLGNVLGAPGDVLGGSIGNLQNLQIKNAIQAMILGVPGECRSVEYLECDPVILGVGMFEVRHEICGRAKPAPKPAPNFSLGKGYYVIGCIAISLGPETAPNARYIMYPKRCPEKSTEVSRAPMAS